MSAYSAMMINALVLGFVVFSLINGHLTRYVSFAKATPGNASNSNSATQAKSNLSPTQKAQDTGALLAVPELSPALKAAASIDSALNTQ